MRRRCFEIYVALCLGAAICVAGTAFLLGHPREVVEADEPLSPLGGDTGVGEAPDPSTGLASALETGVWIVVAALEPPRAERTFDELDAGRFWVNLVSHEFGKAHLVPPDRLGRPIPEHVRLVVVSAHAADATTPHLETLKAFVDSGGCLVLEQPAARLLAMAGARLEGGRQVVGALHVTAGEVLLDGLELPVVEVRLERGVEVMVRGHTLGGTSASLPLVWQRPMARGCVVGTAFDLAHLFLERVQGTPASDFSFEPAPRDGALAGIPVPADLVSRYPEPGVPALDQLERLLWQPVVERGGVPGWWRIPEGAPAAYLCTHDEEGFGDRSVFMAEEEAARGEVCTYFVLPGPITSRGVTRLRSLGGEVALHWHRGFGGGNTRPLKVGPFVWRRQEWSLTDQQHILTHKGGEPLPPITRIHGLEWDPDFDTTFRRMVAAGIRLDSSYGPHGDHGPYLFGSVQPFRPLDRTGALLPILELPFVLQDDEAPPRDRLKRLIQTAAAFHLPVVPIFHCNTMAYKPSVGPIEAWLDGFESARRHRMWRGTMGRYLDFLERRERSTIESPRTRPGTARVEVEGDGLWLRLPERVRGLPLLRVEIDGQPVRTLTCVPWGNGRLALVPIPSGTHRLEWAHGGGVGLCDGGGSGNR